MGGILCLRHHLQVWCWAHHLQHHLCQVPVGEGRCFVVCLSDACGRHGQHVAFSGWDAPSHGEIFCRHCRHFFSGTPSWVQVRQTLDLVSTTHEQFAKNSSNNKNKVA